MSGGTCSLKSTLNGRFLRNYFSQILFSLRDSVRTLLRESSPKIFSFCLIGLGWGLNHKLLFNKSACYLQTMFEIEFVPSGLSFTKLVHYLLDDGDLIDPFRLYGRVNLVFYSDHVGTVFCSFTSKSFSGTKGSVEYHFGR